MKKGKKRILLILLLVLVAIQFKRIDKVNPPVNQANDLMTVASPPENVQGLIKNACYDCHSHETEYPWYTNIAPLSWWIKGHIENGRDNLNFSEWGALDEREQIHNLEECEDMIKKEWMPLGSYARMHKKAQLSEQDRKDILSWIQSNY